MELLRAVHLEDKAEAYSRTLSGGMKRRLMVAKAMVHSPPVLVLDEPTAGVDVELRQQLWAYVRELNERGVTVVLTTHYLEEAEQLCDRIAIINHGKVIANKPTRELVGMAQEKVVEVTVDRDVSGRSRECLVPEDRAQGRAHAGHHLSQGPGECRRSARRGAGRRLRHRRRLDARGRSGGRVPQPDPGGVPERRDGRGRSASGRGGYRWRLRQSSSRQRSGAFTTHGTWPRSPV